MGGVMTKGLLSLLRFCRPVFGPNQEYWRVWLKKVAQFLLLKLCFVQNVNFTTEQFTDMETGTHHISLMPVIYTLGGQ